MEHDYLFYMVEYLPASSDQTPHGEIRPKRLLKNLQRSLARFAPLLLLLLIAGGGCSTRVEVSTETRTAPGDPLAVEKSHTTVAVDVLADEKEDALAPSFEPEQLPVLATTKKGVEVGGIANFAIVVEGDLHVHEHHHEHLHIENRSKPKRAKSRPERVTVEIQRPSLDPECERLRREHDKRVREWEAIMSR